MLITNNNNLTTIITFNMLDNFWTSSQITTQLIIQTKIRHQKLNHHFPKTHVSVLIQISYFFSLKSFYSHDTRKK